MSRYGKGDVKRKLPKSQGYKILRLTWYLWYEDRD
jgi:hypothetical protein